MTVTEEKKPVNIHELVVENFTPVMQQYLRERQKLTGRSVLFFRMGDFYEAFFTDAEEIARELEITLTGRPESNYPGGRLPMAGVPQKAVKPYVQKLLERNYKVYIAEQMADPKTCKGLVPREITKVFTPGTLNDLDFIDGYQNNFILSIFPDKKNENFGLAYSDLSTGEFYVTEISSTFLDQEVARISPSELIAPSQKTKRQAGEIVSEDSLVYSFSDFNIKQYINPFDKENFDIDLARQNLSSLFEINSVDKLIKENLSEKAQGLGLMAAGALVEYFKETLGAEFANNSAKNFDVIRTYQVSEFMMLDAATRRNLELVQCLNGSTQDSLFSTVDKTSSKPGRRKLRNWIEQPLFNIPAINARQDAVQELLEDYDLSNQISILLKKTYDIDRLSNRLASALISPRECNALKESVLIASQISSLMQSFDSGLLTSLKMIPEPAMDFCREIESAIKEDPSINITEGGIIARGYNQELDEYISLVEDSEAWRANYEESQREKLGIKNLKVGFNKVHGYFIETSRINEKKLDENYTIKQTMVNTVRAITPELKDFEEKITNAQSRRNGLEYEIFKALKDKLAGQAAILKNLGHAIAQLDALIALAKLAKENNYCRPELVSEPELHIIGGRHPVVEAKLPFGQFVPNDIDLGTQSEIMLLTGPNMAGKSTFMRQNAIIILLAHIGSFVPAEKACIGLTDRIFTRIGASDDLASGQSTFMVEMTETAAILNGMSKRSFIVLDEIGRGTSTYDGVAIAWSIVEHIAKSTKARTIFATHYHELANLDRIYSCIKNFQVLVAENENSKAKIEFLHKVAPGSADRSYGIEVARLAGLPKEVLSRAKTINNQLVGARTKNLGGNKKANTATEIEIDKLPLFNN